MQNCQTTPHACHVNVVHKRQHKYRRGSTISNIKAPALISKFAAMNEKLFCTYIWQTFSTSAYASFRASKSISGRLPSRPVDLFGVRLITHTTFRVAIMFGADDPEDFKRSCKPCNLAARQPTLQTHHPLHDTT